MSPGGSGWKNEGRQKEAGRLWDKQGEGRGKYGEAGGYIGAKAFQKRRPAHSIPLGREAIRRFSMGRRKRKRKRVKAALRLFLALAFLTGTGTLLATKVFTVEKVEIVGSEYYPDEAIEKWLLDDEHSWNSLYVFFKYKFVEPKEMPFVDNMEVSLKSPHVLQVRVYEKVLLGRVYIKALGQNAYFDKDGFVVEMSSDIIQKVPKVTGLKVDQIVLYEKLPIKEKHTLKNLLSVSQTLKKHSMVPNSVKYNGENGFTLKYGDISVVMGTADDLNAKITRLSQIMPKLEGKKGTLHLEGWSEDTTDITFEASG